MRLTVVQQTLRAPQAYKCASDSNFRLHLQEPLVLQKRFIFSFLSWLTVQDPLSEMRAAVVNEKTGLKAVGSKAFEF